MKLLSLSLSLSLYLFLSLSVQKLVKKFNEDTNCVLANSLKLRYIYIYEHYSDNHNVYQHLVIDSSTNNYQRSKVNICLIIKGSLLIVEHISALNSYVICKLPVVCLGTPYSLNTSSHLYVLRTETRNDHPCNKYLFD